MTTNDFLHKLSPTEEHFLKKFIIENRIRKELNLLNRPDCLQLFGPPFASHGADDNDYFPLLRFFFRQYVASFPFITNNSTEDQHKFWTQTVQPFVESVNSKHLSNSADRKDHTTKRHQINSKFQSGLSLFFNSMIVTDKDMKYFETDHLTPSDVGKLDKIKAHKSPILHDISLDDEIVFTNGLYINIVTVNRISEPASGSSSRWFNFGSIGTDTHFEFVIQISSGSSVYYVSRRYRQFKKLDQDLVSKFPGIMNIETTKLPHKFKNDTQNLVKEKLRHSLRGYLNQLIKFPEIIESVEFQSFISHDKFTELSKEQREDANLRRQQEKKILQAQLEFQKQTSKIMIDFSKKFDDFKSQLIKHPDTLTKLFEEIGEKSEMINLSPILQMFIDWCKIEVSATIFEIFLSQDNSNEILQNVRKFHRLFPYAIMYNILRFTNPMSIISKVISLLLMNLPGTNNKSLLSIMFITLLDDDLNGYETELKDVRAKLSKYPNFVTSIDEFVDDETDHVNVDMDETIQEIIKDTEKCNKYENEFKLNPNNDVLNNLKQLYQLKIRQNDKLILKSLWEEPDLTNLIKNFIIIFYQPLIKLLNKSKMHIFFKDFQKFNDEMIELLVKLNEEEMYFLSSVEIFNKIMKVADNNIHIFWKFIHNMYNNDSSQLFLKLIKWIENFLVKLRMKYSDFSKVSIDLTMEDQPLDELLFYKQLHERMNKILTKRQLYKNHFQNSQPNNTIDKNWADIHETFGDYDDTFGIEIEDLEEINYDMNNKEDLEFQKKLREIEQFKYSDSELQKFDKHLVKELERILPAM